MIRATRKNTQSCVMISVTSFLVGKKIRDVKSGEKLAWNKGRMRKAFKRKGATGTAMGRWGPCHDIRGTRRRKEGGQGVTRPVYVGSSSQGTQLEARAQLSDGSGAGKIQPPGNTLRMEAFSLPAASPPRKAAEVASVIPSWRVNLSRDEGVRRGGGDRGRS